MTKSKKNQPSSSAASSSISVQKNKKQLPVSSTSVKVDSVEIDDMFSALSAKKVKIIEEVKKEKVGVESVEKVKDSKEDVAGGEDLEEEDFSDVFDSATEAEEDEPTNVVKGVAYDPKRDDFTVSNESVTADKDFFDSRGLKRKTRPLTEDGLPIFTPKELKIGLGGGTDLCPFDCNCCF